MAHTTSFIVPLLTESTQLGTIIPKINWTVRTTTKISTVCTKKYTTGKNFKLLEATSAFLKLQKLTVKNSWVNLGNNAFNNKINYLV